jgi:predicted O-methyltransferase YrrM
MDAGKIYPEDVLMMARGFCASRVLLTATELKIFGKLPATAREIATRESWDMEALTILLDALSAMEALEKRGERYQLSQHLADALGGNEEQSILPMIEHLNSMWQNWSKLSSVIQNGRDQDRMILKDPETVRSFIGAMHVIGKDLAGELALELKPVWAKRMLDLGGASGSYTIAFLNAVQGLECTLFDLPAVIPMARERLAKNNLLNRVTLISGDYCEDPLPPGHDLVWLSAIIHQNSREQNRELFLKCFNALSPGGRIWIRDYVMDETRTKPPSGAIFAVNMLVMTKGGNNYTFDEISYDLTSAGFTTPKVVRQGSEMDCVMEAVKPRK